MARYRVGDKYLSESEYQEHLTDERKVKYFMAGALIAFIAMMFGLPKYYPEVLSYEKWIRILIYTFTSLLVGIICSKLANILSYIIGLLLFIVFIVLVGQLIWNVV